MNIQSQFKLCKNIDDLKVTYKKLAMKLHPDLGGSVEAMQELNDTYERMFNALKDGKTTEDAMVFPEIMEKLLQFENLEIDVIGSWIWVTGDTFPIKESLKSIGLRWSRKRKKWYFQGQTFKKRKKLSYEDMKSSFGCESYQSNGNQKVLQ